MTPKDKAYKAFVKRAEEKGLLRRQYDAHKAMRGPNALIADPELIKSRVYESFKMGALAGIIAAAIGGTAGAPLGIPEIGAMYGGYFGGLGGAIKGQADANKKYLTERGFEPKGINLLRYMVPDTGLAYSTTNIIPESGHLSV